VINHVLFPDAMPSEVENITHLDLRGNRLNAAFGWKLIKASQLAQSLPGLVDQSKSNQGGASCHELQWSCGFRAIFWGY